MANTPDQAQNLCFIIKKYPDGKFSNELDAGGIEVGASVTVGVVTKPFAFEELLARFPEFSFVPVFNDKHLSYRWDWADEMMKVARELKYNSGGFDPDALRAAITPRIPRSPCGSWSPAARGR